MLIFFIEFQLIETKDIKQKIIQYSELPSSAAGVEGYLPTFLSASVLLRLTIVKWFRVSFFSLLTTLFNYFINIILINK